MRRERAIFTAVDGEADRLLGQIALAQGGIFTRQDARRVGIPPAVVAQRLRSGLWVAEFGAGLRAATTPLTVAGRERAALARLGEPVALSHLSAARLWNMGEPSPDQVWVTIPGGRRPRPIPGIRVVRSSHTPARAVRRVGGVPVLSPARTVADLALLLDPHRLAALALAAIQRGLCDLRTIRYWQRTLAGRAGSSTLAQALEEADPSFESILSAEFGALAESAQLGLVAGHALALPDGKPVTCDFADLTARIDFEIDGLAYHSSAAQVAADKARDRRLLRAGWVTVRYDTNDVRRRPRETIEDARRQQQARRP